MPTLYIVATPIGNLQDITLRALDTLKQVDVILCEDTRVTAKLLAHFEIKKRLFAYHQHSDPAMTADIARTLNEGLSVALVSDAGTPGINDPGGRLIRDLLLRSDLGARSDLKIIPIPGANAGITALSASGFPADRYQYWGFVPHKKGRQTFFRDIAACADTIVFYESKHRIIKTMQSLIEVIPDRSMMLARELTKKFETLYRGTPATVTAQLQAGELLGEFVVVIGPMR